MTEQPKLIDTSAVPEILRSTEDYQAFRSAADGWQDMDTGKLIENIYASRRISGHPPS